ncbi:hypothetical protein SAMN05216338_1001867 [Bradyrhizobium sp. Rc2d]|uniref:hypothetical protein n=1 Tax=Bradyrhizobium sp. Rc2d TaxID=1855321 RepID=UPI0008862351|nr:hypothetical protein [Bradyrhizobium sp. Rc2d]SDG60079.1 hypothetical protein SAMN05216338_1001867 [Bradyrhizobium sp. Rc2d]
MDWLAGLNADELGHLSRASTAVIRPHIAGEPGGRINGVRAVQPLPHAGALVFPKPLPPAEDMRDRAGGGGGPKRRLA